MCARAERPCRCPAYHFPHRRYGGRCCGESRAYCSACREACRPVQVDYGIGPYEFWGCRGTHHDYAWVSDCCHEALLLPPSTTLTDILEEVLV